MADTPRATGLDVLLERIVETRSQNPKGALDLSRALVERARRNKDRRHEAAGLYELGICELVCSELSAAEDHLNEALRRFGSQEDDAGQIRCRYALANLALKRGDSRQALDTYQSLLAADGSPPQALSGEYAKLLNNIGVCHERLGDYAGALRYYYQSLEHKNPEADRRGVAYSLHNIATIFGRVGEHRRAAAHNRLSLRLFRQLGDVAGRAALYIGLAESYAELGQVKRALGYYRQAMDSAKQAGDRALLAKACVGIARLARRQGELKHAVGNLNVALGHAKRSEDAEAEAEVQLEFGLVAALGSDADKAESRLQRALEMAETHEFVPLADRAHRELATLKSKAGDFRSAFEHLSRHQELHSQVLDAGVQRRVQALSVPLELQKTRAEAEALRLKTVDLARANQQLREAQVKNEELLAELQEKAERLKRESREDPLTGVANRRRLEEALMAEWERSDRFDRSLSLAVFDIDHFKQVNDRHGHAVGDEVLVRIGEELAHLLRGSDLMARVGGEEFVLLLPETTLSEATALCERVREHFEELSWDDLARGLQVTVSFGVASRRGCSDWQGLLKVADEHLYKAKEAGRNRISTGF